MEANKLELVQEALQQLELQKAKIENIISLLEKIYINSEGNIEVDKSPKYGFHMFDCDIADHISNYVSYINWSVENVYTTMKQVTPYVEKFVERDKDLTEPLAY